MIDWEAIQDECNTAAKRVMAFKRRATRKGAHSRSRMPVEAIARKWGIAAGTPEWTRLDVMAGAALLSDVGA